MSAKKSKSQQSLFRQCSKCKIKFLNSNLDEHSTKDCLDMFPKIVGENLLLKVAKMSRNSKILSIPIMKTKISNSLIFLPEGLISEANFANAGLARVKIIPEMTENQNFENSPENELILQVWPVEHSGGILSGETAKAYLNSDGFLTHPDLQAGQTISIRIPDNLTRSPFFTHPSASSITIEIVTEEKNLDVNILKGTMKKKFLESVGFWMEDRVVMEGNVFQIKFNAELVKFIIRNITSSQIDSSGFTHFEVTGNTAFEISPKRKEVDEEDAGEEVTLEDVGGVESVIQEVSSTIKYVLQNPGSNALRGILLFGHHGTGKSIFAQAVCNSFKLKIIQYQTYPKLETDSSSRILVCRSLHEAFREAAINAPSAILIEDIQTVDNEDPDSGIDLSSTLRAEFGRLDSLEAKVIVLATTSDVDSIETSLRSSLLFGREVELPIPTMPAREDILTKVTRRMKHNLSPENIRLVAESTHGFVGADLRALCNNAAHFAFQNRQDFSFTLKDIQACKKSVTPSAMKEFLIEVPNVKWSDIGGQEDLKFKLKQAIEWPLKHPEAFERLGITPPKGFLMYGPPGCSKTMIAKAIATESGLNFISIKGSELFSKWVGESEKAIQSLFRKARQVAPTIVFFDEIDSIGGERGNSSSSGSSVHERVLSQLLIEIDGIETLKDVTIVAATNRPDIIDQALMRPGRLDRVIYVPLPDPETRKDIFRIRFKKMPIHESVEIDHLVSLTDGYSGAEISAVCQEAALKALEDNINSEVIRENHFMEALKIVKPRISAQQIEFYESYSKTRSKF